MGAGRRLGLRLFGLVLFLLGLALVLILLTLLVVVSLLLTAERSRVAVLLGHWLMTHVGRRHVEELILVVEGHRLRA